MTAAARSVSAALDWVFATTAFRVWQRLSQVRGSVLVGGIAYNAFFALFPIVALGFTVFGAVLSTRPDLQAGLVTYLDDTLPGVFKETATSATGLIYPPNLVAEVTNRGTLTGTGIVAILALLWSGLGWVTSLRLGIRAAMHLSVHDFNPVIAKFRDLGIAVLLGGAIIVSAVVSVTAHSATEQMLNGFGVASSVDGRVLTRLVVAIPILALDTLIFWLQFRVLAASPLPAGPLRVGAFAAAVGFGVLKLASGFLLPRLLERSVLTASFGVLIALLVWFNLLARITLLGAAWAGLRAEPEMNEATVRPRFGNGYGVGYTEYEGNDPRRSELDGFDAVLSRPPPDDQPSRPPWASVLDDPDGPSVRSQDRVVLAAGLVLGATAAVGARSIATVVGSIVAAARRRDD